MEYSISHTEITRRKKAYLTLSVSLITGLVFASAILNYPVSIGGYLLVITILFLLGAFSFRFLHILSQIIINLSDLSLERMTNKGSEKYLLKKINRINIKWTTNNTIREIYIWLSDGRAVFISALDSFEEFKNNLLKRLDKPIKIEEMHEPLDFDHPLFYSLLGLPISFIGVFICRSIPFLSFQGIKIGIIAFSLYLSTLGVYFIFAKPISNRFGKRTIISDYITGFLMICSGIIMPLLFLTI